MKILIDVWAGDLHQNLVGQHEPETYEEAFVIMKEAMETGMLVNAINSDFMPPQHRIEEANAIMTNKLLSGDFGVSK